MIEFQKLKQTASIRIIFLIAAITVLLWGTKIILTDTAIYQILLRWYSGSIAAVLQFLFGNFQFDAITGNLIYNEKILHIYSALAIKFYPIIFAILFIFPRKSGRSALVFLAATVGLYMLAVLRFANDVLIPDNLSGFFFTVIVSLRYLIVYLVLKFKISLHPSLQDYFDKMDEKVHETFHFSLHKLLIIISLIPAITGFFDWFLIADWNRFVDALSALILWLSNALLWMLGFSEAYVFDKYILLENYWLYLGTNCLGVGLVVVFVSLIFAIRSPLANRIIFTLFGIATLVVMNALRIVVILLYISQNKIPQHLIEDYHNLSNNVFYVVVFIIVLFYINKFQYLHLCFTKIKESK